MPAKELTHAQKEDAKRLRSAFERWQVARRDRGEKTMKKLILTTAMLLPMVAQAMTYYLSAQWVEGGNRFCKYTDGTVLRVGVKLCPLSIES